MKDPYHNARLRFKVARDRWLDHQNRIGSFDPARAHQIKHNCCVHKLIKSDDKPAVIMHHPMFKELCEAASILHTMIKWGETDEKRGEMLWKLSRD